MSAPEIKYPIEEALPGLRMALRQNSICILAAPPGAGKTTIVPLALLNEPWLMDKKIIMLEPRRLAARRSAEFMAQQLGEKCGTTIGYRIRTETCIGKTTRIEVVTEGILTRMLQSDAELPEAGLVIFDEFHERSIHADTGLAFLLDVQINIRPEIKILIMSATLDIEKLKLLLNDPPVIESHGKSYPVEIHYLKHSSDSKIEVKATDAILSALKKEDGDILVFLPGKGEIRRTADLLNERLTDRNITTHELYGEASREQQDMALRPVRENMRKVILSTSIAETSLTIEDVRIVIDAGLSRISTYDPRRDMPGLITVPVSKASAEQRKGRAGRQRPGICYRLWTKDEDMLHPDFSQLEILTTDLTALALELAQWGTPDAEGLKFPDSPPKHHLSQARSVLFMLGAVDHSGRLTALGKKMSSLPVHPRYAAMILSAKEKNLGHAACLLAAMLEEKDNAGSIDVAERWNFLFANSYKNSISSRRIFDQARKFMRSTGIAENNSDIQETPLGLLLAYAYPERIAQKRGSYQYQLAQGTVVSLPEGNLLVREEYLVIGDADAASAVAKVYLAAPIKKEEILDQFRDILVQEEKVEWTDNAVRGKVRLKLGVLVILEKEYTPADDISQKCILEMIGREGLSVLPWDKESLHLLERIRWCSRYVLDKNLSADWPDMSEGFLLRELEKWFSPFLSGIRRKKELDGLDMSAILRSIFTYEQLNLLDKLVPAGLKVPGGSYIRLKYDEGDKPVLAVKLQELFGQSDTPRIADGKIPVLIHLLSPAMRPLAITQDLRSFWENTYPDVLKQMRAKYHKHVWPDNPMTAQPTNKTKRSYK